MLLVPWILHEEYSYIFKWHVENQLVLTGWIWPNYITCLYVSITMQLLNELILANNFLKINRESELVAHTCNVWLSQGWYTRVMSLRPAWATYSLKNRDVKCDSHSVFSKELPWIQCSKTPFFCVCVSVIRDWTKAFMIARQVLYHLSCDFHSWIRFFFIMAVLKPFCREFSSFMFKNY
jgi:hypothetical protein